MSNEQQIINTLKIRLFDEQEMNVALREAVHERDNVLRKLVSLVGVTPDESGSVSYESLICEIEKLVQSRKEEADDSENEKVKTA